MASRKAYQLMPLRGDIAVTRRLGVNRVEPAVKITGNPVFPILHAAPFTRAKQRSITGIRNSENHCGSVLLFT
jgi:hypothetical protein